MKRSSVALIAALLAGGAVLLLAVFPSAADATTVQDVNQIGPGAIADGVAGNGIQIHTAAVTTGGPGSPQEDAVGTFSGAPAALGFTSGVALTTGSLQSLLTASDPGFQAADWGVDLPDGTLDPDYIEANRGNVPAAADLVRLTLTLTPAGRMLRVSHLFASEEFGQNPAFDDGALILVDTQAEGGPIDKNCALLPGDTAVTVSNVDRMAAYFRTDAASSMTSLFGSITPLECAFPVVPGETVRVRFVAFDGQDGNFDSALLLGADSLTSDAVPAAALSRAPSSGHAPLEVTLDTAGTDDPEGPLATWTLNFGDGQSQNGSGDPPASIAHRYSAAGDYAATFTVTDAAGQDASANQTVSVTEPPPPSPSPPASQPPSGALAVGGDPSAGLPSASGPGPRPGAGPGTPTISVASRATLARLLAGLPVTGGCAAACVLDTALLLERRVARRAGLRGRTLGGRTIVGRARTTLTAAGTRTLRIKLSSSTARKLRRSRLRRVRLRVRLASANGAVHRTLTVPLPLPR